MRLVEGVKLLIIRLKTRGKGYKPRNCYLFCFLNLGALKYDLEGDIVVADGCPPDQRVSHIEKSPVMSVNSFIEFSHVQRKLSDHFGSDIEVVLAQSTCV
ncbi:hypothetical protein L2E82_12280 [Cichorium intybus]|uniref:Uncharacterized protein n=1 Tax=Cichorium intybus TaxID=13427 RepID=A0ACB9GGU8_CICIN|nr:hypothetical protein L2E82_12280 [Cichorium intybus]